MEYFWLPSIFSIDIVDINRAVKSFTNKLLHELIQRQQKIPVNLDE